MTLPERFSTMRATSRWMLLLAIAIVGALLAWTVLSWEDYVKSWVGTHFRMATGGVLGFVLSHFLTKLDLSALPEERRPTAAISQALLIAAGMLGAAFGV